MQLTNAVFFYYSIDYIYYHVKLLRYYIIHLFILKRNWGRQMLISFFKEYITT